MKKNPGKRPNILVCPLDWGIGHATRCIPLIRMLLKKDVRVILAADKRPLLLLRQEFPELPFIRFPGYNFSYPGSDRMALKMTLQTPAIFRGIREENRRLDELIDRYELDAVISDNRFGLYSDKVLSVFMTHQVFIRTPRYLTFFAFLLNRINSYYISKYHECWIPDFEGDQNLSGELSHNSPLPVHCFFIGPQSRFCNGDQAPQVKEQEYDFLALLSGPEPQRTILEEKLIPMMNNSGLKCAMVLGTPERNPNVTDFGNITVFPHLDGDSLLKLIIRSEWVISRPGYSTVMDLAVLGKKAIFVPTPGQTEQEYLADYFRKKGIFYSEKQSVFNLLSAVTEAAEYQGIMMKYDDKALEVRIEALIHQCHSAKI
jgi:uncharacterized protein (TIGR00661 family)